MTLEQTWVGRASHVIIPLALDSLWGLRFEGIEHIPASGPVIIACNHVSWLDGFLAVIASQRVRHTRFLAKEELFRIPGLGWWLRENGGQSLDRSRGDIAAIKWALSVLRKDGCLVMFPEGTRSRTGGLGRGKPGAGFLAYASGASVVPARMLNTDRFPAVRPIGIRFGPPMRFAGEREQCQIFSDQVMEAISRL